MTGEEDEASLRNGICGRFNVGAFCPCMKVFLSFNRAKRDFLEISLRSKNIVSLPLSPRERKGETLSHDHALNITVFAFRVEDGRRVSLPWTLKTPWRKMNSL